MTLPIKAVVTDIEGTTTRIAFVHDVLFPYARARMTAFLLARPDDIAVAAAIAETRRLAPGTAPLDTLLGWMDADAKIGPLKSLQGMIWADGYADGTLRGELYPDVAPALRRWHAAGLRLYVYSSGSVAAQRLLFRHAQDGDLENLFSGFFDTAIGGKRDAASYAAIARATGLLPHDLLFLSDVGYELDAAAAAGLHTCQLIRQQDGTVAHPNHAQASAFNTIPGLFQAPAYPGAGSESDPQVRAS